MKMRISLISAVWLAWVVSVSAQSVMPGHVVGTGAVLATDGQISMVGTLGQPMLGFAGNNSQSTVKGYWARIGSGTGTDVEQLMGPEIPDRFELHGNYPNPFNPTTTIRFTLPDHTQVRLTVFDMLGKVVAVLVDAELAAGEYRATWDALDLGGQPVSSGTYLYRLETTNYSSVQSMTLLK